MRVDGIGEGVVLLSECPCPTSGNDICLEIAGYGVNSLLILDRDQTPFSFRTAGNLWCLINPLRDSDSPLPAELMRITDFVHYESAQGRTVGVWIGYEVARARLIEHVGTAPALSPEERPIPDNPCCCRPYRDGCSGRILCHGTTLDAVGPILESGALQSKAMLSGMSEGELAEYAVENVGDPPDYYHYVCLANGNCVAPDLVAASRRALGYVHGHEVNKCFYPAARFFFDTREMYRHPRAAFDGIQAAKTRDSLELDPFLIAVVIPEVDEVGDAVNLVVPTGFSDRVIRIDHRRHHGLREWSDAALGAVEESVSESRSCRPPGEVGSSGAGCLAST